MPSSALGEPQFAAISGAAGDNTLVAAQGANVKIRVLGFLVAPAAAAVITFQSSTTTNLTGAMSIAAPIWVEGAPLGIFETNANELLNLHQTGVVQLSGWLIWCTAR